MALTADAAVGVLTLSGQQWYTIEQPWRNNQQGHSCVPAGVYELVGYTSPKHGDTWQLHNPALNIYGRGPVPPGGRSFCEIHSANWAEQLEGCIALGKEGTPMYDPLTGRVEPAVEQSVDAVSELIGVLGALSSGHTLTISQP